MEFMYVVVLLKTSIVLLYSYLRSNKYNNLFLTLNEGQRNP